MRYFSLIIFILSWSVVFCQDWSSLNTTGLEYYNQGKYIEATPIIEQSLSVANEEYGQKSEEYITSLNNYAYLLQQKGDFERAIEKFSIVSILSQLLYGEFSIEHIESLTNKANIFLTNGSYDSCEANLNYARQLVFSETQNKTAYYQKNSLLFFESITKIELSNASLLYNRGQLNVAISILENQKRSIEIAYGSAIKTSKTYFGILSSLSVYYLETGELEKAQGILFKSIEFEKQSYGINSYQYYDSQNSLGGVYRNSQMLDSAQIIWEEIEKNISQTGLSGGKIHLSILNNLGELNIELEDYPNAILYLRKSKNLHEQRKGRISKLYQVTVFNLAEAYHSSGNYPQADTLYQELINSLIDNVIHEFTYLSEEEKRAFYKDQLFYIEAYLGFAFEVSNLLPLQDSDTPYINPSVAGQLYNLQLMTKAIILNSSKKMKRHIMNSNDETLKKNYQLWQEKKNQLAKRYNSDQTTVNELIKLAAEIEVLEASLSRYSRDFEAGFSVKKTIWQDIQQNLKPDEVAIEMIRIVNGLAYLAVIITPETTEMPVLALTISTQSKYMEKESYSLYKNAIQYQVEDTISYNVYWRPIQEKIIEHMAENKVPKTVYLSTDGIYSQINLNTLFNKESKQYLIDETEIHLLTNTKEMIEEKHSRDVTGNTKKAVLFGDPSFSMSKTASTQYFSSLAGTGREILLIDELLEGYGWETKTYRQKEASVAQLKANSNTKILHLATHGFFINNESNSVMETLLSSGLAFAGANDRPSETKEDGILTSYETVTLDLDSTDLVVLSACETGRGDYHSGEGVYGLQRAIKVAGAKSIIMSLWKVDDEATQELMVNFYQNWSPGVDKREAFRKAQQQLREKHPQPFYWGAFVMMGD